MLSKGAMTMIKTEIIEHYITENKISKTEFCKRCRIGTQTLKKIYNNDDNFEIIALFKIARIIGVRICDLFNEK